MYETKTKDEILHELNTSESGLSEQEAKKRLQKYGYNRLEEGKKKKFISLFFSQFLDPMIFILMIAAIVSIVLNEMYDAIIILFVVLVNAFIGSIQEFKAERELEALKKLSSTQALVRRENRVLEIDANLLVPGDIVLIEEGQIASADMRLLKSISLLADESNLTGESHPIEKNAKKIYQTEQALSECNNLIFASSPIVKGRGEAVVYHTGMKTEIGKIASLINSDQEQETPLQKKLAALGKTLGILVVLICVGLFLVAMLRQNDAGEMLLTSISLAVAAIPEGLPAIVTIVLAIGVRRMVKVNTIVRKLPAVETLGSVSIVCSDKTGTITLNQMTIQKCYYAFKEQEAIAIDDLLIDGLMLCSNATLEVGDPTEKAIISLGDRLGKNNDNMNSKYTRLSEIPFSSERKMMSVVTQYKGQKITFSKGAFDVLLERSNRILIDKKVVPLTLEYKRKLQEENDKLSSEAMRIIALCLDYGENNTERDLIFVGMVAMIDPPRESAAKAVTQFKRSGIKTVMITGDHIETAFAIAKEVGIADSKEQCVLGASLDDKEGEDLKKILQKATVFARVSPMHKVKIVRGYQEMGNVVAMTGDGVNDAPSLKTADIGIAMGKNGSDVAKNSSEIILLDDNFSSIEKACEEGRNIYRNIKKSVMFLLSSNFAEVLVMFIAILIGFPAPLIAIHILWVNLISDALPALALGADKKDDDIMNDRPRKFDESLFAEGGFKITIVYSAIIFILSMIAFFIVPLTILGQEADLFKLIGNGTIIEEIKRILLEEEVLLKARTYAFTTLGISQLFHMIGMSNVKKSFFNVFKKGNLLMLIAFVVGLALQLLVTEVPFFIDFFKTISLDAYEWVWLILLSAFPLVIHELLVPSFKKQNF